MKTEDKFIEKEIDDYFSQAKKMKCPKSMKQNLYSQLGISGRRFWTVPKMATGLAFAFAASMVLKISVDNYQQEQMQLKINKAEAELELAMHYINRVSFKSLSSVNNNGIRPALIIPLSKTGALL